MKMNWNAVLLLCLCMYGYSMYNMVQISEKSFLKMYRENTTRIDIYDNKKAYIYLNNKTNTGHYVVLGEDTKLLQDLDDIEVLYKMSVKVGNYLSMLMFGMMIYLNRGIGIGKIRSFVGSDGMISKTKTTLEDVAGLEDVKKEVFEFVDFLNNRKKYVEVGAKMPRGALLYGPPGTGKTLLAKAIASESKSKFISVSGSDFSEMFVGVGSARIRNLFKTAREKAPCVVFIDEVDAIGRSRHKLSHHEKDNTLNSLLVELDGFKENDNVLVIGATNRLDMLDKALLRPGRFDRKICVGLPEKGERKQIFEYYLKKMRLSIDAGEVSEQLSKQSCGFSGAEISNICNEACILAVRNKSDLVSKEILNQALDNVQLGLEKKTFRLSEKERLIVAYHESGHTVMSHLCKHVSRPIKVSIMPRGKSALGFSQAEMRENKLHDKNELFDRLCVLMGGRVAEKLFCDEITTGACDDIERATDLAYKYISVFSTFHFQREKEEYSEQIRKKIDKAVQNILSKAYKITKKILKKNKVLVKKLTNRLLEKETLLQTDLDIIFD